MNKKYIPVILALIGLVGGGGAVYNFQIGDNTTISGDTVTSGDTTNIFEGLTEDLIDTATLAAICLQDKIPEEYTQACKER